MDEVSDENLTAALKNLAVTAGSLITCTSDFNMDGHESTVNDFVTLMHKSIEEYKITDVWNWHLVNENNTIMTSN